VQRDRLAIVADIAVTHGRSAVFISTVHVGLVERAKEGYLTPFPSKKAPDPFSLPLEKIPDPFLGLATRLTAS